MSLSHQKPLACAKSSRSVVGRLRWVWPVALAVTILIGSSRGEVAAPQVNHFDKLAHFLVFGLLATLLARTPAGLRRAWLAVVATSLFGISDELHQSLTPGRSVALGDWIADTSGALLAVVLYLRWTWYRGVLEWPLFGVKRRIETRPPTVPEKAA